MKTQSKVMLAVVGTLALAAAAGAQAQEPLQTEQQLRQRTEEQLKNAGEAGQVRTQQQAEQAVQQGAGEKAGAGGQGLIKETLFGSKVEIAQTTLTNSMLVTGPQSWAALN